MIFYMDYVFSLCIYQCIENQRYWKKLFYSMRKYNVF